MLHALELENFKAFGKRARIPFAPITLIFGENSAGKAQSCRHSICSSRRWRTEKLQDALRYSLELKMNC